MSRPQVVGGTARSRARHWGRLIKTMTEPTGVIRELRQKPNGYLTLVVIDGAVIHYWPGLRPSEAAITIAGWKS